jgi:hypothetical protein
VEEAVFEGVEVRIAWPGVVLVDSEEVIVRLEEELASGG